MNSVLSLNLRAGGTNQATSNSSEGWLDYVLGYRKGNLIPSKRLFGNWILRWLVQLGFSTALLADTENSMDIASR
jgi:hypothetical protein